MAITSANQLELLQTAEAVAREKNIDAGLVVEAMEESLARAAKSRYGAEMDIRVSIDRSTGKATFTRVRTVVAKKSLKTIRLNSRLSKPAITWKIQRSVSSWSKSCHQWNWAVSLRNLPSR